MSQGMFLKNALIQQHKNRLLNSLQKPQKASTTVGEKNSLRNPPFSTSE